MFDFIVSGMQAYNQVLMFMAAVVCLGIGGLILGSSLYWRVHAVRAAGTIIGVVADKGMYTPVYRYTLPDGQTHEAKSDIGSGALSGYSTGRQVALLVSPHNPGEARSAKAGYGFDLIGLLFLVPGLWLGYTALTAYPVTPLTWLIGAALIVYLAERGRRVLIPKGERVSLAEWRERLKLGSAVPLDLSQLKPAEEIRSGQAFQASAVQQQRNNRWARPVVGIFAAILLVVGLIQAVRILGLETAGTRAAGTVVRMTEDEDSEGNYTYYPVVRFRTTQGQTVEFKDSVGGNPPLQRAGDQVTVLYPAADASGAIIDRGAFWNAVIPALLIIGGGLLAWLFVAMWRSRPVQDPAAARPATTSPAGAAGPDPRRAQGA